MRTATLDAAAPQPVPAPDHPAGAPYSARMEAEVCTMLFALHCAGLPLRRVETLLPAPR